MEETAIEQNAVEPPTNYAGFWIRTVAYLIDTLIVYGPLYVLTVVVLIWTSDLWLSEEPITPNGEFVLGEEAIHFGLFFLILSVLMIINLIVPFVYKTCMEHSRYQATLGKLVCRIKVVDAFGQKLTFSKSALRFAIFYLSISATIFVTVLVAFTEKKQGLHDIVAKSLVIRN